MVFGCFVDFASAFDFLNRDLLIQALEKIGIENEFLHITKAIYENI